MRQTYDVIVIGGGHAGAEAAYAAALMGARTALVTVHAGAIGRMSCNPAIGGLGKGQMVREVDALGGLMGRAIDATGIQFRLLNTSKGPAVQAPRAQADRQRYADWMRQALEACDNLQIVEGMAGALLVRPALEGGSPSISGVQLEDGRELTGRIVVVTTGTFLRGLMHCGDQRTEGGRFGEAPARSLSDSLRSLGLTLGRLKTGTPPRVHRDSLDYSRLDRQPGDASPTPFSFETDRIQRPQIDCWITYTNEPVHRLIRDNLDRAPMFNGQIQSTGPRYCPSIEHKVVRFADKPRHQIFLEPEGYDSERVYCNGISTSLPADVQERMVRDIPGLKDARILQYGYAIEYDFVPSHQIGPNLETKSVRGLFLAGQINGTSGYEEAAGQGILAGINAVRSLSGSEPILLGRDQAYLGVMIDDLVTRPLSEPYRMFTSRAEYRLHLRADNADERLTPIGREAELVGDARWERFREKQRQIEHIERLIPRLRCKNRSLAEWLRRPDSSESDLTDALVEAGHTNFAVLALAQVYIHHRYGGYLDRQQKQIERFRNMERSQLPEGLDYGAMNELRLEARERLASIAPRTLGQASRIPGINPADLSILMIHLKRHAVQPRPR